MLKLAGWAIGIVSICWAAVGFVNVLSKLHFVMDAWSWCVSHTHTGPS
jgi:hypothetical protein